MRRFFAPPEQSRGGVFELPEREARHATQVLRLSVGDDLTVLDGAGGVLICVVEAISKRSVRVTVRQRQQHAPLPCPVTLVPAVPKGSAFDTIIQKATELGVARIIPLLSERVVVQINEREAAAKVEKWQQIAIESIKQCGSPWLPVIELPISFDKFAAECARSWALQPLITNQRPSYSNAAISSDMAAPGDGRTPQAELAIVASLESGSRTLREVLSDFSIAQQRRPKSALVWIGPEGDFTPAEYAALAKLGAAPVTLGPLILRADTAAIAILSVLNYELAAPR